MEKKTAVLMDMPTSVRGFVFLGDDGEPVIVVNSRLTREQNIRTFDHEQHHIQMKEMDDPDFHEYGGGP